jgi:hypothetical protein
MFPRCIDPKLLLQNDLPVNRSLIRIPEVAISLRRGPELAF